MKNVLIVENQTESLRIDESVDNSSKFLLSGSFTEFDVENRNKRFYTAENFLPVMQRLLEKKKLLGVIYGEFDHPDVFDIAGKNASHAIENLTHNENANRVDGSIALLSTHWGKEAKAIINDGYPLFVSSRAAGVTDANGGVMLKELFTYDIVLDPGFASSQVSINESCGYNTTPETHYRIYEMKDGDVNNLHNDNKNDNKTHMDLKFMEQLIADEMVKLEHQLMSKISKGQAEPSELVAMSEKYELLNEELVAVKAYLEGFKTKMNTIIIENNKLKESNKSLVNELNESILYSNHLSSGLKKLNEQNIEMESRLSIDEKMIEYVAENTKAIGEHTKANVLMTEDLCTKVFEMSKDLTNNAAFLEYVANETKVAQDFSQQFAQDAAKEIKVTQEFLDNTAKETEVAQKFVEYVANESFKDQVFLNYISEKVDGMVGYQQEVVDRLKSSTPVLEHVNTNIETIHNLSDIKDYLGITEEREIINNVTVETETETNVQSTTEDVETTNVETTDVETTNITPVTEEITDEDSEDIEDVTTTEITPETTDVIDSNTAETETEIDNTVEPTIETEIETDNTVEPTIETDIDTNVEPTTGDTEVETSMETSLLSSLVKILGSDDTGIVIEVTPDNKVIIQKSGTDETVELGEGEFEVMNLDENITNAVSDVLAEIKKQKVLSNQQPHFMTFMSEQQIADFKSFDKTTQDAIILAMDENEYFTTEDVLNIIGKTLNDSAMSYEDKLISNLPENIKEAWNGLSQDQKVSVITESKYFALSTSADIKNFWATRPFAKAVTGPDATLIKESINNQDNENLSDDYINAFLSNVDNLNIK